MNNSKKVAKQKQNKMKDLWIKDATVNNVLKHVKQADGFKEIPKGYWIIGLRNKFLNKDKFQDTFILMMGEKFIFNTSGTTTAGKWGLLNFGKWNKKGCAVVKGNQWHYDLWSYGLHRKKMEALVQVNDVKYFRDNNKNDRAEEIGQMYSGKIGINFHCATYFKGINFVRKLIGKWSVGCQVCNNVKDYYAILKLTENQQYVSYCLLNLHN